MEKRLFIFLGLLIVFSFIASSQFSLSEPEDIYNLDDRLFVTATNLKGSDKGNLNIDLVCENKTVNLLKIPARTFSPEGGQAYSIPYKILSREDLEIDNIMFIVGNCIIRANLANNLVETKKFTISDSLLVNAKIDKIKYDPGEEIDLELKVKKANGDSFDGFYMISNFTDDSGEITNGILNKKIRVRENMPAGNYFMNLKAFNKDSYGSITNKGSFEVFLIVNQVPTGIKAVLSNSKITPNEELRISASVLDQSGLVIEGPISIHISDPDEQKKDYNIASGENLAVSFPTNATKGIWTAYFVSNNLVEQVEFEIKAFEAVNYSLEAGVLIVENIGNIDYFGLLKINIGETTKGIELRLPVGKKKEFILEAPEGDYEISISDGKHSFYGTSFLTGSVVSVREKGGESGLKNLSLLWIFLIFLAGSFGIVMIGMYNRTRFFSKKGFIGNFKKVKKEEEEVIDFTNNLHNAESSLVLDGDKIESVIVVLKIKDRDSFNDEIQKKIIAIIRDNCGSKAAIEVKKDFIFLIYSPLITKTYRNEFLAVKNAVKIADELLKYEKKLSTPFVFSISVHSGDLVSKKEGSDLKYTSVGNLFSIGSKIADLSNNNVLISEKIRKHLIRDLKLKEVSELSDIKVYSVEEIKDHREDRARVDDIIKRIGSN